MAQVAEWMGAEMWAALAEKGFYAGTSVGRSRILMVLVGLGYHQRDHVKSKQTHTLLPIINTVERNVLSFLSQPDQSEQNIELAPAQAIGALLTRRND